MNHAEIAQNILHETGEALRLGQFERFEKHFWLPTNIWTGLGKRTLRKSEEIRDVFERVRWHHSSLRLSCVKRQWEYSVQTLDKTILTVHSVTLFRGAVLVQEPHKVLSRLVQKAGVWRIASSDYGIYDSLKHNRALLGPIEVANSKYASDYGNPPANFENTSGDPKMKKLLSGPPTASS